MRQYSRKIYGWQATQESLRDDLKDVDAGQSSLCKVTLILLSLIFTGIAGTLSGVISSIIPPIFHPALSHPANDPLSIVLTFSLVILTIAVWLIETPRKGYAIGFQKALVCSVGGMFLLLLSSKLAFDIFSYLLLLILFTILTSLSTLTGATSLILTRVLFGENRRNKHLYSFFTVLLSVVVGWYVIKDTSKASSIHSYYLFNSVKVLSSFSLGVAIIISSNAVSDAAIQNSKNFESLKLWVLALTTWKGTSFFNLDLSRVDFSRSRLANTDLRARQLYRTCFQDVIGLNRARVDDRYLDLTKPKVQQLLTQGESKDKDFSRVNLQGAYLQGANLQKMRFYETNFNGADLKNAQLQDAQFIRTIATGVDFRGANLTGACIKDLSINRQTEFDGVLCDYIYRGDKEDQLGERYPSDHNFAPGEFAALIRQLSSTIELVFEREPDPQVLDLTFEKFRLEDGGLGLELAGVEAQGNHWVVKVTHPEGVSQQAVRSVIERKLEENQQEVSRLRGTVDRLIGIIETYSRQSLGSTYNLFGNVGNVTDSGTINYREAIQPNSPVSIQPLQQFIDLLNPWLKELQQRPLSTNPEQQIDFLQQALLKKAEVDPTFQTTLLQLEPNQFQSLPPVMANAIQRAITQLGSNTGN